jgi:uncharacterized protein YndB with AHSA1/START domain
MKTLNKESITVAAKVNAPVEMAWKLWTDPEHIVRWNFASDDWYTPYAENDLKEKGRFLWRMEAKDGSFGFNFSGTYTKIVSHKEIESRLDDDRNVSITFSPVGDKTLIIETFETEGTNPVEMQKTGWQAILDNFKKYAGENVLI